MAQAPHPRMHGITHLTGGSDPIPGLLPVPIDYPGAVLADPCLIAYWPGDEATGDLVDRKGSRDLVRGTTHVYPTGTTQPHYGDVGPFDESCVGSTGQAGNIYNHGGKFAVALTVASTPYTIEAWARLTRYAFIIFPGETVPVEVGQCTLFSLGDDANIGYVRSESGHSLEWKIGAVTLVDPDDFPLNSWQHVAFRADGTTLSLFRNGILRATAPSTSLSLDTPVQWLNGSGAVAKSPWNGSSAHLAVYDCALDDATIIRHSNMLAELGGGGEGQVLTLDENGNPVWMPPAVEVTGGGINPTPPDETPVDTSSSYGGTPTTPSGWHLQAHTETVILHDSTRGRFDVPSMKWTRVPFNAVRISRTWEPTVGSATVKTALLPDDRGLSGPARDGILHINADMVWSSPQTVGGWFSIEYPVLEPGGLPDDDPEVAGDGPRPEAPRPGDPIAAPDTYMRAARMMNVSQGYVLRTTPGADTRAIFGWGFWDTADGIGDSPFSTLVDNPFPTWPIWAARPLHMLQPYPQMSPTESRTYYVNYQGDPGFRFDGLQVDTDLAAGANLCLQAWQDSPWLIRFSTDRFPNYHGYTGTYRGYPYLAITFAYDPDTIDHTTGKLLLPAPA